MVWYSVVDRSELCGVGSVGSSWSAFSFTGRPSWMGSGGFGEGVGVAGGFLTGRSPRFLVDGFLFSVILSPVRRKHGSWCVDIECRGISISEENTEYRLDQATIGKVIKRGSLVTNFHGDWYLNVYHTFHGYTCVSGLRGSSPCTVYRLARSSLAPWVELSYRKYGGGTLKIARLPKSTTTCATNFSHSTTSVKLV